MDATDSPAPERSGNRTLWYVLGGLAGCGCLVVLIVVGGSMLLAPTVMRELQQAQADATWAKLRAIEHSVQNHALQNAGALPATLAEAGAADGEDGDAALDFWGHPIRYEPSADGAGFTLTSLGADSAPGGEGPAADLVLVWPAADTGPDGGPGADPDADPDAGER